VPSTVADVFASAGLQPDGVVPWGTPVPEPGPGVYVVALTADARSLTEVSAAAPLDGATLARLLNVRPELRLDKSETSVPEVASRLEAFWLPDEVVLYIGLAGTSVRSRVRQYYTTPLGARKPHAGGWWLKTLTVLDDLWVHYAATGENAAAEVAMLQRFAAELSPQSRARLHDADDPAPFANLRTGRGFIKKHGITGATGELITVPSVDQGAVVAAKPPAPKPAAAVVEQPITARLRGSVGSAASQTVTDKDIDAGRVRFPRPAKRLLPPEREYVAISVRGRHFARVRWDPRIGADKERSGLLALGKGRLDGLVDAGEVLTLAAHADGRLELG
jgi:hypothetical protein